MRAVTRPWQSKWDLNARDGRAGFASGPWGIPLTPCAAPFRTSAWGHPAFLMENQTGAGPSCLPKGGPLPTMQASICASGDMPPTSFSPLGLMLAAAMSVSNVFTDVARKHALADRDLIPAT